MLGPDLDIYDGISSLIQKKFRSACEVLDEKESNFAVYSKANSRS